LKLNHHCIVTLGIGLAITFAVGIATGLIHQPEQAMLAAEYGQVNANHAINIKEI